MVSHLRTVWDQVDTQGFQGSISQLLRDEIVNRVFKGTGLELIGVIDDHHGVLVIVVGDEVWHAESLPWR